MHACVHSCTCICIHACTHTYIHACVTACIHNTYILHAYYIHTYIHTYTHTYIYRGTYPHMEVNRQWPRQLQKRGFRDPFLRRGPRKHFCCRILGLAMDSIGWAKSPWPWPRGPWRWPWSPRPGPRALHELPFRGVSWGTPRDFAILW